MTTTKENKGLWIIIGIVLLLFYLNSQTQTASPDVQAAAKVPLVGKYGGILGILAAALTAILIPKILLWIGIIIGAILILNNIGKRH